MAPRSQSDLVKIGLDGFKLIDECFGRKGKPQAPAAASAAQGATGFHANPQVYHYHYHPQESYYRCDQPQQSQVVRVTKVSTTHVRKSYGDTAAPQEFSMRC